MKIIYASNTGAPILVDDDVYVAVGHLTWLSIARKNTSYVRTNSGPRCSNRGYYLHRVVAGLDCVGSFKRGRTACEDVDHVNGDGTDNRRSNLRVVTRSQNMMNQKTRANNSTGTPGVRTTVDGNYNAFVYVNGKYMDLKTHKNKTVAELVRLLAERVYYGEYAPGVRRRV